MSDWIHALSLGWMAVLIFGLTFLICTLTAVAMVHADKRFIGQSGVRPTVLLQVQPDGG